jgi:hypothetical protein
MGLVIEESGKSSEGRSVLVPSLSGLGNVITLKLKECI